MFFEIFLRSRPNNFILMAPNDFQWYFAQNWKVCISLNTLQFFLDLSTSPPLVSRLRPCWPERWATCWATDLLSSNWFWTNTALLAGPVWLGRSSMLWLLEDQVRLFDDCPYYVSMGMEVLTVDTNKDVRYRHSKKKCQVLKRQFLRWDFKLMINRYELLLCRDLQA